MAMQYELDQARAISEIARQLKEQNALIKELTVEVRALQMQLREAKQ